MSNTLNIRSPVLRATESAGEIGERLALAWRQMEEAGDFDHVTEMISTFPGFAVFPGAEVHLLRGMQAGAVGQGHFDMLHWPVLINAVAPHLLEETLAHRLTLPGAPVVPQRRRPFRGLQSHPGGRLSLVNVSCVFR